MADWVFPLIAFAFLWGLCFSIIRQNLITFYIFTLMTLNPIYWVVNVVYISRRWSERDDY